MLLLYNIKTLYARKDIMDSTKNPADISKDRKMVPSVTPNTTNFKKILTIISPKLQNQLTALRNEDKQLPAIIKAFEAIVVNVLLSLSGTREDIKSDEQVLRECIEILIATSKTLESKFITGSLRDIAVECVGTDLLQLFPTAIQSKATSIKGYRGSMAEINLSLGEEKFNPSSPSRERSTSVQPSAVPPLILDKKRNSTTVVSETIDRNAGLHVIIIELIDSLINRLKLEIKTSYKNKKSLIDFAAGNSFTFKEDSKSRKTMALDILNLFEQGEFTKLKTPISRDPMTMADLVTAETELLRMGDEISKFNLKYKGIKSDDSPLTFILPRLKYWLDRTNLAITDQNAKIKMQSPRLKSVSETAAVSAVDCKTIESRTTRLDQKFLGQRIIIAAPQKDSATVQPLSLYTLMTDSAVAKIKEEIRKTNPDEIGFFTELFKLNAKVENITAAELTELRDTYLTDGCMAVNYGGDQKKSLLAHIKLELANVERNPNTEPNLNANPFKETLKELIGMLRDNIDEKLKQQWGALSKTASAQSTQVMQPPRP